MEELARETPVGRGGAAAGRRGRSASTEPLVPSMTPDEAAPPRAGGRRLAGLRVDEVGAAAGPQSGRGVLDRRRRRERRERSRADLGRSPARRRRLVLAASWPGFGLVGRDRRRARCGAVSAGRGWRPAIAGCGHRAARHPRSQPAPSPARAVDTRRCRRRPAPASTAAPSRRRPRRRSASSPRRSATPCTEAGAEARPEDPRSQARAAATGRDRPHRGRRPTAFRSCRRRDAAPSRRRVVGDVRPWPCRPRSPLPIVIFLG